MRLAGSSAAGGASGGLGGLVSSGIGALFGGGGGAAGWSKVLGLLGRESGGPVMAGQPYIVGEKRPELFVPNVSGRIVPRIPNVAAGGGSAMTFAPTINMPGADSAAVSRMASELDRQRREFQSFAASLPARTRGIVNQGIERRAIGRGV